MPGLLVPMFEIRLNGKEIEEKYYNLIESITYEDCETGSDTAVISAIDPNMEMMDNPDFVRGSRIKIRGGWKTDLAEWLDGYISIVDVDFPIDGSPSIQIHCMDQSYIVDHTQRKQTYTSMKFSTLATMVASRYGFKVSGPPTTEMHDEISQADESDLKLLLRIADDEDLGVKIKNNTIIWWKIDDPGEVQDEFHWKEPPFNLAAFNSRLVLADKKHKSDKSDVTNQKIKESGSSTTGTTSSKKDGSVVIYELDPDAQAYDRKKR